MQRQFLTVFTVCLCAAIHPSSSKAADTQGMLWLFNKTSCVEYVEDRKLPDHTGRNGIDQIYVGGWLSAYNALVPDTYDITGGKDIDSVMQWIDKFCRDNPFESVQTGLIALAHDLYPNRLKNHREDDGAARR